jgi:allophanate hydrolase
MGVKSAAPQGSAEKPGQRSQKNAQGESRGMTNRMAGTLKLVVCGAHMRGLPLNHQLVDRGALFVETTRTAAAYRLFALAGDGPARPGLVRGETGAAIALEAWSMPLGEVDSFLDGIPWPLGLGKILLADGSCATGFLCDPIGTRGARDITEFADWRAYLESIT